MPIQNDNDIPLCNRENSELQKYKRDFDYQTLYEMHKDLGTISNVLNTHIIRSEATDTKIEELTKTISVSNGKKCLIERIDNLYKYFYIGTGIILTLGGLWTFVSWIIPLIKG